MSWRVQIAEEFEPELSDLPLEVRRAISRTHGSFENTARSLVVHAQIR